MRKNSGGGRTFRIYVGITLGIALVAVIITVAVMLPARIQGREEREDAVLRQEMESMEIDLTDLKIPSEFRSILKDQWYPYRPKMEQWTKEQAEKFWIDPKEIGSSILQEENKKIIESIFETVP